MTMFWLFSVNIYFDTCYIRQNSHSNLKSSIGHPDTMMVSGWTPRNFDSFWVCVLYFNNGLLGKGRPNLSRLERLSRPFPSKPFFKYKTHTRKQYKINVSWTVLIWVRVLSWYNIYKKKIFTKKYLQKKLPKPGHSNGRRPRANVSVIRLQLLPSFSVMLAESYKLSFP